MTPDDDTGGVVPLDVFRSHLHDPEAFDRAMAACPCVGCGDHTQNPPDDEGQVVCDGCLTNEKRGRLWQRARTDNTTPTEAPDVTPDDDNDGVELWRYETTIGQVYNRPSRFPIPTDVSGRWFTTLRAEQLLAIERAGRLLRQHEIGEGTLSEYHEKWGAFEKALDALRPAAPGTPESPNQGATR